MTPGSHTAQTDAITCNIGIDGQNNVPANKTAEVAAGSTVKFMWTEWKSDHPGPGTRALFSFVSTRVTDDESSHDLSGELWWLVQQVLWKHWQSLGQDRPGRLRRFRVRSLG